MFMLLLDEMRLEWLNIPLVATFQPVNSIAIYKILTADLMLGSNIVTPARQAWDQHLIIHIQIHSFTESEVRGNSVL